MDRVQHRYFLITDGALLATPFAAEAKQVVSHTSNDSSTRGQELQSLFDRIGSGDNAEKSPGGAILR